MLKHFTSIAITVFLLSAPLLAVVQFDNCDRPCCQVEVITCCSSELVQDCLGTMAACDTPLLLPLVVAPVNKVQQEVVDTVSELPVSTAIRQVSAQLCLTAPLLPPRAEPPPAFQLPLLI